MGQFAFLCLLHDSLVDVTRDDALFAVVLSEKEIEQQTETRGEKQDNDPSNRFEWIAILRNNDQYQSYYSDAIGEDQEGAYNPFYMINDEHEPRFTT